MPAIADFTRLSARCARAGLSPAFIDTFQFYYDRLVEGATGYIARDEAQPVDRAA